MDTRRSSQYRHPARPEKSNNPQKCQYHKTLSFPPELWAYYRRMCGIEGQDRRVYPSRALKAVRARTTWSNKKTANSLAEKGATKRTQAEARRKSKKSTANTSPTSRSQYMCQGSNQHHSRGIYWRRIINIS